MSSIHRSLEKARRPARIEPVNNSEPEKAKSVPGFEPGSLGQNATALPLAPPPRPYHFHRYLCLHYAHTDTYTLMYFFDWFIPIFPFLSFLEVNTSFFVCSCLLSFTSGYSASLWPLGPYLTHNFVLVFLGTRAIQSHFLTLTNVTVRHWHLSKSADPESRQLGLRQLPPTAA